MSIFLRVASAGGGAEEDEAAAAGGGDGGAGGASKETAPSRAGVAHPSSVDGRRSVVEKRRSLTGTTLARSAIATEFICCAAELRLPNRESSERAKIRGFLPSLSSRASCVDAQKQDQ